MTPVEPLRTASTTADVIAPQRAPATTRAYAVDALRGLGILGVVLGQTKPYEVLPAWMYHAQEPPPTHAVNMSIAGLTFPDLVFPIFLFTIGVAIPLAMTRRLEKGVSHARLLLGALSRGALLLFLALLRQHFDGSAPTYTSAYPDGPPREVWVIGLVAFAVLFLVFTRFPQTWSRGRRLSLRAVGWAAAIAMFALVEFPDGSHFRPDRIDDILVLAAYSVVFGTLIWMATRENLLSRLATLAIICAFILLERRDGWVSQIYAYDPLPWLYQFSFFKYLCITIPGLIVGDLMLRWTRAPRLDAVEPGHSGPWTKGRAVLIALVSFSLVPLVLVGIQGRYVFETTVAASVICVVLWLLTRRPRAATESLISQLVGWGTFWLVMGLLLDPFEEGTRKLPVTFAWFFQTSGLAIFILVALVIVMEMLRKPRWLQLLVDSGQNPMIAYVGYGMLVLPLLGLSGIKNAFESREPTPWVAFAWAVIVTVMVAYVTRFFTRRKLFWRT
jgi:predicted acyltransferase